MPEPRFAWVPVARWELYRVLRRADFIASVLLTPLIALGSIWLGGALRGAPAKVAVVWLAPGGTARALLAADTLPARDAIVWTPAPPAAGADPAALLAEVRARRLDGVALVPHDYALGGTVELLSRRPAPRWRNGVESALRVRARTVRAEARGITAGELVALDARVQTRERTAQPPPRAGGRDARGERVVVLALLVLMMAVLFSTISYLMIGISGEKQARVTEVVVSAVSPEAWMDGKLVAFTGIGLIMALVWAGSLLAMAGPFAFALPGSVRPGALLVYTLYAVLGLYLYNALFAALMATLQGIQSTAKFQGYFFMLPFVPLCFIARLIEDPNAGWLAVLSQVPLFSSSLIPARMVMGAVPAWEVVLGLALLIAASWGMRHAAGRIFRVGMLMYGKDLTLPEIVRWAREG